MIFMALFYFLLAILTISLSNDLFGYINLTNVNLFLNFGRVVIMISSLERHKLVVGKIMGLMGEKL